MKNHEKLFFLDTEIIDFGGLDGPGGPGGPRNPSKFDTLKADRDARVPYRRADLSMRKHRKNSQSSRALLPSPTQHKTKLGAAELTRRRASRSLRDQAGSPKKWRAKHYTCLGALGFRLPPSTISGPPKKSTVKGIPKWFFGQVVFWRPGVPRPKNHKCSGK